MGKNWVFTVQIQNSAVTEVVALKSVIH
jgi:hypothetical protein